MRAPMGMGLSSQPKNYPSGSKNGMAEVSGCLWLRGDLPSLDQPIPTDPKV